MCRCWNCGARFDEPDIEHTTYESYFGVSSMFPNSHSMELEICPNCGSEEIEEEYDEEDDEDVE